MEIDLHVHSNRSDGALPPAECARAARAAGLDLFALTDHDTTDGFAGARAEGERLGIEVLLGCEISSHIGKAPVHMLGYLFDPAEPALAECLQLIRDDRIVRARHMVERLQELGVPVTFERVREIAKGDSVGRPHVAQAMVEAGVIKRTTDAFTKEWIGNGGRAHIEKYSPSPVEAVRLIRGAGGVAVVAHPVWLGQDGVDDVALIEELAEAGMAGIEVDHPDQDEAAREKYRALAARLGLFATGSSDFHGNEHGPVIGICRTAPEVLERIRALAAHPIPKGER